MVRGVKIRNKWRLVMMLTKLWKASIILCFGLVFLCSDQVAFAMPQMDFTLYGRATVRGKALRSSDTNHIITLEVNGVELVRYIMGSSASYGDYYVLKVPMDSDPRVRDKAYRGDIAKVFINGRPISENPVTIGSPGETVLLDISIR
ncbi:hypothetical protein DRO34_06200 [Candidatus Bathyarchaeota archaeon]|nr:MAG: hypothetical protein DRO34_06200 [Candidatus Bathyarchaeota archaeon]